MVPPSGLRSSALKVEQFLQEIGAEGWELVAVDAGLMFFKRPKRTANGPEPDAWLSRGDHTKR